MSSFPVVSSIPDLTATSEIFTSNTLANPSTALYGINGNTAPSSAPTIPVFVSATTSSITVQFNVANITGKPTPSYALNWGPVNGPFNNRVIAAQFSGTIYFATFSNLTPNTPYQCQSVALNSSGQVVSDVSPVFYTLAGGNSPPNLPPSVPQSAQSTIPPTSITLYINTAGITGTPEPNYSIDYGPSFSISVIPVNVFGSLYAATITGLTPSTSYTFRSVAANSQGFKLSTSTSYTTSSGTGTPPSGPPTVPIAFGFPTSTSITVRFDAAGITGTPTPTYNLLYGTTTSPTLQLTATLVSGTIYQGVATGLSPNTTYYFKSEAVNGVLPNAISAVSAGIATSGVVPQPTLKNLIVMPFLIQGPRFNSTFPWPGIDYQLTSSATGATYTVGSNTQIQGTQLYGSMYCGTIGTPGNLSGDPGNPVPYAGACQADQPFNTNYGSVTNAYTSTVRGLINKSPSSGLMLTSIGGFYADVLGLFGPNTPAGFPGTMPTAQQVVQSFLYMFCGITTNNTNPLNWKRTNSNNTSSFEFYTDGWILDFENVGMGNPLNNYPTARQADPGFPAQATNPTYAPYIDVLGNIPSQYYAIAPTLFFGNAPVSLSIIADKGTTNICAANTALNTWYAFPTATVPPTAATYNNTSSKALNHPVQLSYMDDIFIQFYNENADYYPGGQYFANLLACWGYVALQAQKLGRKKTTINLGLAKGNIIPGYNFAGNAIIPNVQGPTPQLDNEPLNPVSGYEYWYPQYATNSPPNSTTGVGGRQSWPNTGPTKDPLNVSNDIKAAHAILQNMTQNPSLLISDWLSGMGFWAAQNATLMAKSVYDKNNSLSPANVGGTDVLPHKYVYMWGDATYPAPDPGWTQPGVLPITANW